MVLHSRIRERKNNSKICYYSFIAIKFLDAVGASLVSVAAGAGSAVVSASMLGSATVV